MFLYISVSNLINTHLKTPILHLSIWISSKFGEVVHIEKTLYPWETYLQCLGVVYLHWRTTFHCNTLFYITDLLINLREKHSWIKCSGSFLGLCLHSSFFITGIYIAQTIYLHGHGQFTYMDITGLIFFRGHQQYGTFFPLTDMNGRVFCTSANTSDKFFLLTDSPFHWHQWWGLFVPPWTSVTWRLSTNIGSFSSH